MPLLAILGSKTEFCAYVFFLLFKNKKNKKNKNNDNQHLCTALCINNLTNIFLKNVTILQRENRTKIYLFFPLRY